MPPNDIGNRYIDGDYLEKTGTWHAEDSPYKAKIVDAAIQRNRLAFANCVDIGCGAGKVVEILSGKYPDRKFTGYELSHDVDFIWKTNNTRDNLSYSHDNIFDMDARHDVILCLDVFEHVEDYFGFLKKLHSKGKYFIFNVPMDMNMMKIYGSGLRRARDDAGHLHYFNPYTAARALTDTGYDIVEARLSAAFLHVPPRNAHQAAVLPLRLATLLFGKGFSCSVFGGMSLLVTARNPAAA